MDGGHQRYLRELVLPHPAMKVILEEYLMSIQAATERIQRCEAAMRALLDKWRLGSAVEALMAFKGFQTVAAMILVSELGALDRFTHPRQVMAYLGLIPARTLRVTNVARAQSLNAVTPTRAGCWWSARSIT